MGAGHMGASGRFDRLKEVALAYAFAIKVALADAAQARSATPIHTAAE
jgi:oligopeptidase B